MADHLPKNIRTLIEDIRQIGNPKIREKLKELDVALAAMVPAKGGGAMRVESIVASKTGNPLIHFIWGSNKGELDPVTARGYALQILEACEAATQDAALYRAITEHDGTDEQAFTMINLVREKRRKFEE